MPLHSTASFLHPFLGFSILRLHLSVFSETSVVWDHTHTFPLDSVLPMSENEGGKRGLNLFTSWTCTLSVPSSTSPNSNHPPFPKLAPLQSAVFSATVPGTSVFSAKWVPFAVPIVGNLFGIFGLFVLYMVTQFLAACFPTGSCHLVQTLSELRGGTLEILRLF